MARARTAPDNPPRYPFTPSWSPATHANGTTAPDSYLPGPANSAGEPAVRTAKARQRQARARRGCLGTLRYADPELEADYLVFAHRSPACRAAAAAGCALAAIVVCVGPRADPRAEAISAVILGAITLLLSLTAVVASESPLLRVLRDARVLSWLRRHPVRQALICEWAYVPMIAAQHVLDRFANPWLGIQVNSHHHAAGGSEVLAFRGLYFTKMATMMYLTIAPPRFITVAPILLLSAVAHVAFAAVIADLAHDRDDRCGVVVMVGDCLVALALVRVWELVRRRDFEARRGMEMQAAHVAGLVKSLRSISAGYGGHRDDDGRTAGASRAPPTTRDNDRGVAVVAVGSDRDEAPQRHAGDDGEDMPGGRDQNDRRASPPQPVSDGRHRIHTETRDGADGADRELARESAWSRAFVVAVAAAPDVAPRLAQTFHIPRAHACLAVAGCVAQAVGTAVALLLDAGGQLVAPIAPPHSAAVVCGIWAPPDQPDYLVAVFARHVHRAFATAISQLGDAYRATLVSDSSLSAGPAGADEAAEVFATLRVGVALGNAVAQTRSHVLPVADGALATALRLADVDGNTLLSREAAQAVSANFMVAQVVRAGEVWGWGRAGLRHGGECRWLLGQPCTDAAQALEREWRAAVTFAADDASESDPSGVEHNFDTANREPGNTCVTNDEVAVELPTFNFTVCGGFRFDDEELEAEYRRVEHADAGRFVPLAVNSCICVVVAVFAITGPRGADAVTPASAVLFALAVFATVVAAALTWRSPPGQGRLVALVIVGFVAFDAATTASVVTLDDDGNPLRLHLPWLMVLPFGSAFQWLPTSLPVLVMVLPFFVIVFAHTTAIGLVTLTGKSKVPSITSNLVFYAMMVVGLRLRLRSHFAAIAAARLAHERWVRARSELEQQFARVMPVAAARQLCSAGFSRQLFDDRSTPAGSVAADSNEGTELQEVAPRNVSSALEDESRMDSTPPPSAAPPARGGGVSAPAMPSGQTVWGRGGTDTTPASTTLAARGSAVWPSLFTRIPSDSVCIALRLRRGDTNSKLLDEAAAKLRGRLRSAGLSDVFTAAAGAALVIVAGPPAMGVGATFAPRPAFTSIAAVEEVLRRERLHAAVTVTLGSGEVFGGLVGLQSPRFVIAGPGLDAALRRSVSWGVSEAQR